MNMKEIKESRHVHIFKAVRSIAGILFPLKSFGANSIPLFVKIDRYYTRTLTCKSHAKEKHRNYQTKGSPNKEESTAGETEEEATHQID